VGQAQLQRTAQPIYCRKATRPIRIILHSSSFHGADREQLQAIELIRELTNATALEVIATEPGALPYLQVDECSRDESTIPIAVTDKKSWKTKSAIR
jgi:hypothetical protein